ncbi:hypothetical protein P3X46_034901, partial [Hevea brasiliensis]
EISFLGHVVSKEASSRSNPNKNKCLKYLENSLSWVESENLCKSYGGHLVALTSSQELSFAKQLRGQIANCCWVGGRDIDSTVGFDWKWSDNSSYWNKKRRKSHKLYNLAASALIPPSWKVFTDEELRSITKNFSEGNRLLGDAKTGGTYSGLLPDGSRVAVKRLKRSDFQRKKDFYSEIGRVARLHHPNLVAIKGCCYDHGDRYIVYEFIVNGPLDRWLHHIPRGGRSLDWTMRMKIATTLAQGIAFLHDKVKPHVVHRDIRASNVLLDEEFGAHLMGVGLSKFVPWEVIHERTVMAGGTYGYLAPEFVYRNELTTKSDVYSFGVLLLEIVTGRRPAQAVDSVGWQSIFEWATPLVQAHRYPDLLDPLISSSSSEIPEAGVIQKVVDLVYTCTQHVPSMRPRMSHVVHQLQQLAQSSIVK